VRLVLSWLREFVDLDAPAEDIAEKLSIRGFEVASMEALDGGDAVIDFEITANRPDCLSVIGLAREIATTYSLPLRDREQTPSLATGRSDRLAIHLDDQELCPRYAGAVADVKIGPSPGWLTARLHAAGVRPISNIVDITNYVNLEIGQPMHAFDLAKLAGPEIRVRRAKRGESIVTLDDVERKLDPDMLVIADCDRAQAIAGVMGGAASEVSASTTAIVLESAYFKPSSVRRTSKRLGLKTEASARFERGADIGAQVRAIERAAALIAQIGAGRIAVPVVDCYPQPRGPVRIVLRRTRLGQLLGAQVPDGDVERILRALGLDVRANADGWETVAPTFRVDLLREADLIEEVGRHYGFDRLDATFPVATAPAPAPDPRIARDQAVRRVMTAAGASEAITFAFIEAKAAEPFASVLGGAMPVAVANPLSAKFDTLRPLLLPGLVDAVAHNRRHGRRDVRLFEIGSVYLPEKGEKLPREPRRLALVMTGRRRAEFWAEPDAGAVPMLDFFDMKGVVEALVGDLHLPDVAYRPAKVSYLHPGKASELVVGGNVVGQFGVLHPKVAEAYELGGRDVLAGEFDLEAILAAVPERHAYVPVPRFPAALRDIAVIVDGPVTAERVLAEIRTAGGSILRDVRLFDLYRGESIPAGKKSTCCSIMNTVQN